MGKPWRSFLDSAPRRLKGCAALIQPLAIVTAMGALAACKPAKESVRVVHAEALTQLVQQASDLFERHHRRIRIERVAAPTLDIVRGIRSNRLTADVVLLDDADLIERFLLPSFADSSYRFLGDEMVLAGPGAAFPSRSEREVWEREWPRRLLNRPASFGLADPDRCASGYRTHQLWKLAEIHYNEILYRRFVRLAPQRAYPTERDLVDGLKSGALDFAFLLRSTAIQNDLAMMRLPDSASLGEPSLDSRYAHVFHRVRAVSGDDFMELPARAAQHGICGRRQAPQSARSFIEFLLGSDVAQIAEQLGYARIRASEAGAPIG